MHFPSLVVNKIIQKHPSGNLRLVCRDWKSSRSIEDILDDKYDGDKDKVLRCVLKSGDYELSAKTLTAGQFSGVYPMEYLKIAAQSGNTCICKMLIDHEWNYMLKRTYITVEEEGLLEVEEPYIMAKDVRPAIIDAIDHEHINVIKFFLDNYVEKSWDHLHKEAEHAIKTGRLDIFRLLIEHAGVSIGYINFMMTFAAERGKLDICRYLYAKGATPDSVEGRALIRAARNGHYDVCVFLTTVEKYPARPCHNQSDALRVAAMSGHLDICTYLINTEMFGRFAAKARMQKQAAITGAITHGHGDVVSLLVKEKGVNMNALLTFAAKAGKPEMCELLIQHGADPKETLIYSDEVLDVLRKEPPARANTMP